MSRQNLNQPPNLMAVNVEAKMTRYDRYRVLLEPIHRLRGSSTNKTYSINQLIDALVTILARATADELRVDWVYVIALVESIMDTVTTRQWRSMFSNADPTIGELIGFLRMRSDSMASIENRAYIAKVTPQIQQKKVALKAASTASTSSKQGSGNCGRKSNTKERRPQK